MEAESIIVSTSYFPPIGYILVLQRAKEIFIELQETYPKQTCRNHFCIYSPNGKQTLSVPVNKTMGNHTLTRDIRIRHDLPWQKVHRRSVEAAYNNSPFFIYYKDYFLPFFDKKYNFLTDLNSEILETIFRILHIQKELKFTESYIKVPVHLTDHRLDLTAKHDDFICPPYFQTFSEKYGFIPNLSILDLIFNLGPEAEEYLNS
jgi:hypothetical protein